MKKTKHTVALALAAMLACQPLSVYAATPQRFCFSVRILPAGV